MHDPWLERQLRLAERQGLLHGRRLSPVQSFGIELLEVFDALRNKDKRERWRADALRLAIVVRDASATVTELFPDWFPPDVVEAGSEEHQRALAAGAEEDLSGVTWMSPSSSVDDEWAEIQRQIAAQNIDVVEGQQQFGGGEWL